MVEPNTDSTSRLVDRALGRAGYEWQRLFGQAGEGVHFAGQPRHGVRCLVLGDSALPDAARDALLAWRLAQYLRAGFYDHRAVASWADPMEPHDTIGPNDCSGWRGTGRPFAGSSTPLPATSATTCGTGGR